jgi:hypothetical protein
MAQVEAQRIACNDGLVRMVFQWHPDREKAEIRSECCIPNHLDGFKWEWVRLEWFLKVLKRLLARLPQVMPQPLDPEDEVLQGRFDVIIRLRAATLEEAAGKVRWILEIVEGAVA